MEYNWKKAPEKPLIGEYSGVIVSDGKKVGIGHYDFDMGYWHYNFVGEIERDDNNIIMWTELPELPNKLM